MIPIPLPNKLLLAPQQRLLHLYRQTPSILPPACRVRRRENHRVVEVSFRAHHADGSRLLHAAFDLLRARDATVGEHGYAFPEEVSNGFDFGPRGEPGETAFGFAHAAVDGDELGAGGEDVRGVGESTVEGGKDSEFGDDGD